MKNNVEAPVRRIRVQFQTGYVGIKSKVVDSKSMTQPDMSLSIRELLMNHSRGLGLGVSELKGEYFDTEVPVDYDLVDALERRKNMKLSIDEAWKKAKEEKAAAKKVRAEKAKAAKEEAIAKAKELLESQNKDLKKEE